MKVFELINELQKIKDKNSEVIIFNDHQLNEVALVDEWENMGRVDLNIGKDCT